MEQTFYSIHDYYIAHHGVKGQKWGIRRYQNPDGTLTEEGKKRYAKIESKYRDKEGNFSTKRNALNDVFRTIGGIFAPSIGGIVGGITGGPAGGTIGLLSGLGVGLGLTVKTVASQIQRRNARNFAEKTGMVSSSKAWNDRFASAMISGIGMGPFGAVGGGGVAIARGGEKMLKTKISELSDYNYDLKAIGEKKVTYNVKHT